MRSKSLNLTLEGVRLLLRAKELLNKLVESMVEVQELKKGEGDKMWCVFIGITLLLLVIADVNQIILRK